MPRPADSDGGSRPPGRVTLFLASGCHLCEAALDALRAAQALEPFEAEIVDITGNDGLEAAYRAFLPVIEIDGIRAFTYFVTSTALLERLGGDGSPAPRSTPAGSM